MIWILAKLDRLGIKILPGFDHDDNDRSWAGIPDENSN